MSDQIFKFIPKETPPSVETLVEGKAWVLRGVFSEAECLQLIDKAERTEMSPIGCTTNYRRCDRVEIDAPELSSELYRRVVSAGVLPPSITVSSEGTALDSSEVLGFGIEGEWQPSGLNDHMRFCRYSPGGFFLAHRDGYYMPSSERRSFFTCMLYLNGSFEGGQTNFLDADKHNMIVSEAGASQYTSSGPGEGGEWKLATPDAIIHSIVPEAGLVLVFYHPLLHEGGLLHSGVKYMTRTEVMYDRVPGSAPGLTAADREAVGLFEQASAAESQGLRDEAIRLYKKIAKLSTRVADHYGL